MCYKNGGGKFKIYLGFTFVYKYKWRQTYIISHQNVFSIAGTFLLIYFIAMFGCGIPIFFQEVATGQYLGSGGLTMIGQLVPILQGSFCQS